MKTTNKFDDAKVGISARRFWQTGQLAFYDLRVFYSNSKQYQNVETRKCYEINEKEKSYNDRIINIEHGAFTPLEMSANAKMGRESQTVR